MSEIANYAVINASSSGDNTLVAAVSGRRIRVLSANFIAAGTVNATFKSGASTAKTGAYPLVAQSGAALAHNPTGHFETDEGEALVLGLDAAVLVAGSLTYVTA